MKLKEIFEQLSYGELSQLNLGGSGEGVIDESNYARIIAHINLGLGALHKRFSMRHGDVRIQLIPNLTMYQLNSKFAATNRRSREPVKYLQDTEANPFIDDVNKIEKVETDDGQELHLNNESELYSVFTPGPTTLRVPADLTNGSMDLPDELKTQGLKVTYRAGHVPIKYDATFFDPSRVDVSLPNTHLEALLLFVASRVHNPIGMQNEFNAGNNWAAKYEKECQYLEALNYQVDQGSQSTALARNGWV